jgi:hypothetical protein
MRNKAKITLVVFIGMMMLGSVLPNVFAIYNKQSFEKEVLFEICDDEISVSITIGAYEIKNTDQGHEVTIEDFGHLLIPGKPNLPSRIFAIAIPPGSILSDVSFDYCEGIKLPGTYEIIPTSIPRVIGEEDLSIYELQKKEYEENYNSVYKSNSPYPNSVGEVVRTAGYRKYNLVDVRITPFIYSPLSGNLVYYSEVVVNIKYSFPDDFSYDDIMIDNVVDNQKIAAKLIVNYGQAKNWYPDEIGNRESYDYVIITIEELTSHITELVEWEENKGRNVNVVTTEWINSNRDGYDLAEKMRNFLIEKYSSKEWGIEYVCLIGNYEDVPMRLTAQNTGYGQPETDYYFAELSFEDSESWDANGNHLYGENSDPIDFYAEVNVGRIPWSDPEIVEHICEKSVAYEQNDDPSFKKNILLIGTFFWPDTDNAVLMELKVNSEDHPWMEDWTMTRMYEEDQSSYECDYDVSYGTVKTVWSEGTYAFVDWAGHGSPTACYEYYPSQPFVDTNTCNYLNDDYPAIIFADACSNSDTDYNNIGQMMMKQGAVGFLGSTKVAYGYHGWDDPYDGTSESLDYFFTTCCTSGNYTQGQAHQYALLEMYIHDLWYYQYYEAFEWGALWGNPDLGMVTTFYNKPPETPNQPDGPNELVEDKEYTFTTQTSDPEGEQIYYLFDWGDGTDSGWIGPYNSGTIAEESHIWFDPGEYNITVRAKDINGFESHWSDPLKINVLMGPIIDVVKLLGGFFKVSSTIKNRGETEATNIVWKITLDGGRIFKGKETTGTISSISPGDEVAITSDTILGFGQTLVKVTAEIPESSDIKSQKGMMYLIFININPAGD